MKRKKFQLPAKTNPVVDNMGEKSDAETKTDQVKSENSAAVSPASVPVIMHPVAAIKKGPEGEDFHAVALASAEVKQLQHYVAIETERRKIIIDYVKENLIDGVDFGQLHMFKDCPNHKKAYLHKDCPKWHFSKKTLFKPGSEKICSLMHLTPRFFPDTGFLDSLKSMEGKMIISALICKLENDQGKFISEGRGTASISIVGAEGYSLDFDINKLAKMAEKRSQVDAVLRLGFSEFFTQDMEDHPDVKNNNKIPPQGQSSSVQKPAEFAKPSTPSAPQISAPNPAGQTFTPSKLDLNGVMPWGGPKGYKNRKFSEIPVYYLFWLSQQPNVLNKEEVLVYANQRADEEIGIKISKLPEMTAGKIQDILVENLNKTKIDELTTEEKVKFLNFLSKELDKKVPPKSHTAGQQQPTDDTGKMCENLFRELGYSPDEITGGLQDQFNGKKTLAELTPEEKASLLQDLQQIKANIKKGA